MTSFSSPTTAFNGLDYNDAAPQFLYATKPEERLSVEVLKQRLHHQLTGVLSYLFPLGEMRPSLFVIGNVQGESGESLKVELQGPKIGMWHDFATGEGGDILSLWGEAKGFDPRHEFPEIISSIYEWLGMSVPLPPERSVKPPSEDQLFPSKRISPPSTNLGSPTGQWYYRDQEGAVLVRVCRYDTEKGKEFRPFDVRAQVYKAPYPRPLYNQPGMAKSDTVIVVEGEKCAQTLIDQGFCATTAMNGSKAPLDKTDWSPLRGKHVILWPDHDVPGQDYGDRLIPHLKTLGLASLSMVRVPKDKPETWDAADAFKEELDVDAFLKAHGQPILVSPIEKVPQGVESPDSDLKGMPIFSAGQLIEDTNPFPDDWVSPRILTPGGLLVFGGAPKVGKTDLILSWLAHLAAGLPFLGMMPPRPLKIFYLQTEIMYDYLRERLQNLKVDPNFLPLVKKNLFMTPQIRMLLNEDGVTTVYNSITRCFGNPREVDILVIDPLRNVYDGGKSGSENDNMAMLAFLQDRVEKLRFLVNPKAGVILTHHTKKITKTMVEEDPFQALSGAASLRSFYTTGMVLFRADEKQSVRQLIFELRNGKSVETKVIDKVDGFWREMSANSERLVRQDYGEKLDAERARRHDVILQLLFDEAGEGRLYTPTQFRQAFEGRAGLGGERTIHNRLNVLSTKGYIKFNTDDTYKVPRSKSGVMCVEGMRVPVGEEIDGDTGEAVSLMEPILPTHFKESQSGAILPVENPQVWVYLE